MKSGASERKRATEQSSILIARCYTLLVSEQYADGRTAHYIADSGRIEPGYDPNEDPLAETMYKSISRALKILRSERKNDGALPLLPEDEDHLLQDILAYIGVYYKDKDIKAKLPARFRYETKYFSDIVGRRTGMRPAEHIRQLRIRDADHLLAATGMTLQEIADSVGYSSASGLAKAYRKYYKKAPGSVRKRGQKKD